MIKKSEEKKVEKPERVVEGESVETKAQEEKPAHKAAHPGKCPTCGRDMAHQG